MERARSAAECCVALGSHVLEPLEVNGDEQSLGLRAQPVAGVHAARAENLATGGSVERPLHTKLGVQTASGSGSGW